MDKVTVSADALRKVLEALSGPGYHIRELQYTRRPETIFKNNPINILVREFNEHVDLVNKTIPIRIGVKTDECDPPTQKPTASPYDLNGNKEFPGE